MLSNQYVPQIHFHPGETLSEKLEEMGINSDEFAALTGKPQKAILAILNGKSPVTHDMAVQFESVTQIPVRFWLNNQRHYDEFMARKNYKKSMQSESVCS